MFPTRARGAPASGRNRILRFFTSACGRFGGGVGGSRPVPSCAVLPLGSVGAAAPHRCFVPRSFERESNVCAPLPNERSSGTTKTIASLFSKVRSMPEEPRARERHEDGGQGVGVGVSACPTASFLCVPSAPYFPIPNPRLSWTCLVLPRTAAVPTGSRFDRIFPRAMTRSTYPRTFSFDTHASPPPPSLPSRRVPLLHPDPRVRSLPSLWLCWFRS